MPEGNAQALPHGYWHFHPHSGKLSKLILNSGLRLLALAGVVVAVQQLRSLSWKYVHKDYIGKTMSLGTITTLTHEPLSAAEIDKLKAEQAAKQSHYISS